MDNGPAHGIKRRGPVHALPPSGQPQRLKTRAGGPAGSEVGAVHVGIIQSLPTTCRLQGVDPYTYLVDVLQRVGRHPASDAIALTPRVWKWWYATASVNRWCW